MRLFRTYQGEEKIVENAGLFPVSNWISTCPSAVFLPGTSCQWDQPAVRMCVVLCTLSRISGLEVVYQGPVSADSRHPLEDLFAPSRDLASSDLPPSYLLFL